jgi:very-short-patch-repair endonuclease
MLNPAQVLPSNLGPFFWLAILVVVVVFAVRYYTLAARRQPDQVAVPGIGVSLTQRPILTAAETKFFRALQAAVGKQYTIFPQLPLWTLVQPESNDPIAARVFNNRISLKRIDFILVDSTSLMPYMAIELDDRSHQQEDRQKRDAFVDEVLNQAGIKIVHIRTSSTYDLQTIRGQLGLSILVKVPA